MHLFRQHVGVAGAEDEKTVVATCRFGNHRGGGGHRAGEAGADGLDPRAEIAQVPVRRGLWGLLGGHCVFPWW
jgi:hypothetical protein